MPRSGLPGDVSSSSLRHQLNESPPLKLPEESNKERQGFSVAFDYSMGPSYLVQHLPTCGQDRSDLHLVGMIDGRSRAFDVLWLGHSLVGDGLTETWETMNCRHA